jgi:hypothetical protein
VSIVTAGAGDGGVMRVHLVGGVNDLA